MITKTAQVMEHLKHDRHLEAMRIAHTFRHLGPYKAIIQRGWDAVQNPRFARSLGRDPDELWSAAVSALQSLYEKDRPTC